MLHIYCLDGVIQTNDDMSIRSYPGFYEKIKNPIPLTMDVVNYFLDYIKTDLDYNFIFEQKKTQSLILGFTILDIDNKPQEDVIKEYVNCRGTRVEVDLQLLISMSTYFTSNYSFPNDEAENINNQILDVSSDIFEQILLLINSNKGSILQYGAGTGIKFPTTINLNKELILYYLRYFGIINVPFDTISYPSGKKYDFDYQVQYNKYSYCPNKTYALCMKINMFTPVIIPRYSWYIDISNCCNFYYHNLKITTIIDGKIITLMSLDKLQINEYLRIKYNNNDGLYPFVPGQIYNISFEILFDDFLCYNVITKQNEKTEILLLNEPEIERVHEFFEWRHTKLEGRKELTLLEYFGEFDINKIILT